MSWGFEQGRVYNRRQDIHGRFNGQRQGGIITPADFPLVIIITGEEGLEHGYADRFRPDGAFEYFGEGQIGDMQMMKGNAVIANHSANGRDLLLFRKQKNGSLRFEGQFVYENHHIERAPDREENERDAIVFELRAIDSVAEQVDEIPVAVVADLAALRTKAFDSVKAAPLKREAVVSVFVRSQIIRDYVVQRAKGVCEGCELDAPFLRPNGIAYLEPHHIRRLTDGGPDDPRHVIALCPNCHRRVHFGSDGVEYNKDLAQRMLAIEAK